MLPLTLFSTCLLLQTAQLPEPLESGRVIWTDSVVCGECGVKVTAVATLIADLRTAPRGSDRESAARALRGIAWKCHPDVVVALSDSLLHDPDGCVRREAAESLTKLGACQGEAHFALQHAAARDRNLFVRAQAKRGLKSLSHRCDGDCAVCETGTPVVRGPGVPPIVQRVLPPAQINLPGVHINIRPGRVLGIDLGRRRPPPDLVFTPPDEPGPRELAPIPEEVPPFSPSPSASQPPFGPSLLAPQPPRPGATVPVPDQPVERRTSQKPAPPVSERWNPKPAPSASERSTRKPAPPATDLPPLIGPSQGTSG
jgi:hypothetical protein